MKNGILGLFLLLIMTACNTNNKSDAKKGGTVISTNTNYYSEAIGIVENGEYTVTDSVIIKKAWETSLKNRLRLKEAVELDSFEIIKTKTEGDTVEDCYIIVSKTKDGSIAMSAILKYENDKFYFDTKHMSGGEGYLTVICKGECEQGCYPGVSLYNHEKHLVCSACTECEKIDGEMY